MDLSGLSGEIFLGFAALFALIISVFASKDNSFKIAYRITLISFIISGIFIMFSHSSGGSLFLGSYRYDELARFSKILILFGAFFSLMIGYKVQKIDNFDRPEYPVLVLLSVLGMLLMTSAGDLISLYMSLELQSLPLYVIAAIRRDNIKSTEAGLKYFLLGALSSGILLYGMSLIYGSVGSTSFIDISYVVSNGMPNMMLIGLVFILSGLAFKISVVPFHMWTPDVYEGAHTPVTALFAIVPKVAAMTVLIRLTYSAFGDAVSSWQQILIIMSILSMILGSFAAIMQNNLKRLMAYSSIAHMGYALVGVCSGTKEGISSVLIYMSIYVIMSIGSFIVILSMRRDGQSVEEVNDLKGFSRSHPFLAFSFLIFMFSMAGIPPLAGFFGKWLVFSSAVNAGLIPLAVIGVLTSVVGAFYYLRIIKIMYFDDVEVSLDYVVNKSSNIILVAMILLTICFSIIINWFLNLTMDINLLV